MRAEDYAFVLFSRFINAIEEKVSVWDLVKKVCGCYLDGCECLLLLCSSPASSTQSRRRWALEIYPNCAVLVPTFLPGTAASVAITVPVCQP